MGTFALSGASTIYRTHFNQREEYELRSTADYFLEFDKSLGPNHRIYGFDDNNDGTIDRIEERLNMPIAPRCPAPMFVSKQYTSKDLEFKVLSSKLKK